MARPNAGALTSSRIKLVKKTKTKPKKTVVVVSASTAGPQRWAAALAAACRVGGLGPNAGRRPLPLLRRLHT